MSNETKALIANIVGALGLVTMITGWALEGKFKREAQKEQHEVWHKANAESASTPDLVSDQLQNGKVAVSDAASISA